MLISSLSDPTAEKKLEAIYKDAKAERTERIISLIDTFENTYGEGRDISVYSVPGRSELSGNHTDHNHGRVIAASIDLDIIAVASPRDDGIIRIKSEGFPEDTVDISLYTEPDKSRFGSSASLIAGMVAGFRSLGLRVGGFDACTTSNVLKGSGLSSSAAFEDMIGNILNHLYNHGSVDNVEIAKLAQLAENKFFGKPCGLMDQVACAVGGIVSIDFNDPKAPVIEKLDFDITGAGYRLCIVDTGGNHADLTPDYAAVPAEMKAIAKKFGKEVLRDVKEEDVLDNIMDLRTEFGDRAVLRALHFFAENRRVKSQGDALRSGDLRRYFDGVIASGRSSFCYLQNVYTTVNVKEQGLSLALNLAERYLQKLGGAYRVHGGGFAGTIQAYVPAAEVKGFCALMDGVFGAGSSIPLCIRPIGATKIV
ncbi:MAG: galactokinase [Ruminococcaceae bacterium]|nr:galactokinase [Oscillospiraceae bacterium]